jgi:hypothetical protein
MLEVRDAQLIERLSTALFNFILTFTELTFHDFLLD